MAQMNLRAAVIEQHASGDEGIRYLDVALNPPKGMDEDQKDEWLGRQAEILNAFIKEALLDAGYEIKER
jgi:hypothetical protein